tara:strand:- start:158 stop:1045 length:888 start_codon:yes stop_codon:yes gene_type:complete
MNQEEIENLKKAGKIAAQTVEYAKSIIKKDMPLVEIAEKIESKIQELGAKPAFPVSLAIDEVAAHATPPHDSGDLSHGLLKVDLGAHIDGYVADTAFSLDLDNNQENQNLIKAAETALQKATKLITINTKLKDLGSQIEQEIKAHSALPVTNLSGHSIDKYELHAGITIPNFDNSKELPIPEGLYAIEPFSTNGFGAVRDGKPSGIYRLEAQNPVRDATAREVLQFIKQEYQTLPFCSRWLVKKFGTKALLALKRLEDSRILHQYPQLIEKGGGKVAQAEHTVLLTEKEKIITTA